MAESLTCAKCTATVDRTETVYTVDGTLVCNRCHQLDLAHEHVERAREAALAEAAHRVHGPASLIGGFLASVQADDEALDLHRVVDAMAALPARPRPALLVCARCRAAVPHDETTYDPDGRPLCAACAGRAELESDGRRDTSDRRVGWVVAALCAAALALVVVAYLVYGQ